VPSQPRPARPALAPDPSLRLTIHFRERTRKEVILRYCLDVMKGGMLIRAARQPALHLGCRVTLRFLLAGGEQILAGTGLVAWLQRGGVGIQLEELDPAGEELHREMLTLRERQGAGEQWLAPEDRRLEMELFDEPTTPVGTPLPFIV